MRKLHWLFFPSLAASVVLSRISLDFYLPALPAMSTSFNATEELLETTLTVFSFGYAVSLLISGPLSDIFGQIKILLSGIFLYLIATIVCIFASSIEIFIIARFFQALGGCAGTVIARTLVRDVYDKKTQLLYLADITACVAIFSLIVPLFAGWSMLYWSWRVLFYGILIFAGGLFICISFFPAIQKETVVPARRILSIYKMLLFHRHFLAYSFAAGFAWCGYFAFTVQSSFLLQKTLRLTPPEFGTVYSYVIAGFFMGTQLAKCLTLKMDEDTLIFRSSIMYGISAITLLALSIFLPLIWQYLIIPIFFIAMGTGIIIPCTQAAVLQPFPKFSGCVSGLYFFIQMGIGAVGGGLLSLFNENAQFPLCIMLLLCSSLLVVSFYKLKFLLPPFKVN